MNEWMDGRTDGWIGIGSLMGLGEMWPRDLGELGSWLELGKDNCTLRRRNGYIGSDSWDWVPDTPRWKGWYLVVLLNVCYSVIMLRERTIELEKSTMRFTKHWSTIATNTRKSARLLRAKKKKKQSKHHSCDVAKKTLLAWHWASKPHCKRLQGFKISKCWC